MGSAYRTHLDATERALSGAAWFIGEATRAHEGHFPVEAVDGVLAALEKLREAIVALDARLREEEKILAE